MAKAPRVSISSRFMDKIPAHEKQADEIHTTLYDLASAARAAGNKKLPAAVRKAAHHAKKHIGKMHKAMRDVESTETVKDNESKGE